MVPPRGERAVRLAPLHSISKPAARMRATCTRVTARASATATTSAPHQPTMAGSRAMTPMAAPATPTSATCEAGWVG